MIAVDSTIRYRGEVGTVRQIVEPAPGWSRARVRWTCGDEQYVDLDKLDEVAMPDGPELPASHELGGES